MSIPVYRRSLIAKDAGTMSGITLPLIREVVVTLGYNDSGTNEGPDKQSDHDTIDGLERTAYIILGDHPIFWSNTIQQKYKNEQLGQKLYKCFRPILPKGMKLLTFDVVAEAMRVYEDERYFQFAFYGPFPANHQWKPNEKQMKTDRFRMGFVINTTQGDGSHWVALWVDLIEGKNEYFDSIGMSPSVGVRNTVNSILHVIKSYFKNIPVTFSVDYTNAQKQFGITECGVYVCWFLAQKLYGASLESISNTPLPDSECKKLRKFFWNEMDLDTKEFEIHS